MEHEYIDDIFSRFGPSFSNLLLDQADDLFGNRIENFA